MQCADAATAAPAHFGSSYVQRLPLQTCERQSPSLLDWRAGKEAKQLVLLVDPAVGLPDMIAAGIGPATEERTATNDATSDPEWKKAYLAAVDRARESGDATAKRLPALVWEGGGSTKGATLEGALAWR